MYMMRNHVLCIVFISNYLLIIFKNNRLKPIEIFAFNTGLGFYARITDEQSCYVEKKYINTKGFEISGNAAN